MVFEVPIITAIYILFGMCCIFVCYIMCEKLCDNCSHDNNNDKVEVILDKMPDHHTS